MLSSTPLTEPTYGRSPCTTPFSCTRASTLRCAAIRLSTRGRSATTRSPTARRTASLPSSLSPGVPWDDRGVLHGEMARCLASFGYSREELARSLVRWQPRDGGARRGMASLPPWQFTPGILSGQEDRHRGAQGSRRGRCCARIGAGGVCGRNVDEESAGAVRRASLARGAVVL